MIKKSSLLSIISWLGCFIFLVLSNFSFAQNYPNHPIRLIIPFAPGGVTDIGGRYIANQLSLKLGQQVVVENKSGASGNIGASFVAQSDPDGYTLLLGFDGTLVINPHIFEKIPFDTIKDFASVAKIGDAALILVANNDFPGKTVSDIINISQRDSKGLSYATSGTGADSSYRWRTVKAKNWRTLPPIPYKSGGQALIGLMSGDVPLAFTVLAGASQYVQNGRLKPIAISSKARVSSLPNVPTFIESGYPDIQVSSWIGVLAPAKTPRSIINTLNTAINDILQTSEAKGKLSAIGISPTPTTPEKFSDQLKVDLNLFGQIVKIAGIKAE
jgi:tripartite-type tricarboxylate transporter receptor subunit TctC